jgi:hypothetical protein
MLYLFGVLLGSVLSYFLLFHDRQFPAFWPAGVVKERLARSKYYSNTSSDSLMQCLALDPNYFIAALPESEVVFRHSLPRRHPCPVYALRHPQVRHCLLMVELCDTLFTFYDVRTSEGLSVSCRECK